MSPRWKHNQENWCSKYILFGFVVRGSSVQDQLRNVTDLAASAAAFAAIADGCLVTWGHPDFGGESYQARQRKKKGWKYSNRMKLDVFFRLNHRLNWVTEISNPVILTRLPFEQVNWFLLDAYAVIQQRCLQKDLQPWNSLCRRRWNCLKLKKSHDHCDHLMTSPWVGLEF